MAVTTQRGGRSATVTFRVPTETYNQLQDIMAKSGASFADLIKRGAEIQIEETQQKLEQIRGLRSTLMMLNEQVRKRREELNRDLGEEREAKRIEMQRMFTQEQRGIDSELHQSRQELDEVNAELNRKRGELKWIEGRLAQVREERTAMADQTRKLRQQSQQAGALDPMFMLLALMMLASMTQQQQPQQHIGGGQNG